MEFRVLGPLEVIDRGTPVQLTAPMHRALLATLLLHRGEAVPADTLVDDLWGERPPESAASLLRLYASQVRRALPDGRLVSKRPGYALQIEPGEVDADAFEELLADGRRAAAAGNARLALSLFRRALALWRGPALADLRTTSFAADEAARLDDLRVDCTEERIAVELELGRHAEVLPELEQLVEGNAFRERLRGSLMLALYRAGRQVDALSAYRDARRVLVDELGIEPGPELRQLERRILDHDPSLDAGAAAHDPPSTVPPPRTATVGRTRELADIRAAVLGPAPRLLTLVGPGGIGKTRLATEVASSVGGELADGAVLVDLAPVAEPERLLPTIGRALGLHEVGTTSWVDLLTGHLAERQLVLVLDNVEHLVDGVAPVATVLDGAPRVTVLATSRRPLRISGEQVIDVQPLAGEPALTLLEARATAAGAVVDGTSSDLAAVSKRLEGIPLAIELAAPWLRSVQPAELVQMLDSRLAILGPGARDSAQRHHTMRSAIDWGFELLDSGEQHLLGRLSLFAGGFDTEAMLAVGGPARPEQLAQLVDVSIVHSNGRRHRLLEVVREYAAELPSADDEGRDLHAAYFLALAELAESELAGATQEEWLERLEAEHDNLRAALDWLARRGDSVRELRLAAALGRFWYVRGYLSEGLARLRQATARGDGGDDNATLAKALRTASALGLLRGELEPAQSDAERALALYRASGDQVGVVRSLNNLGAILSAVGEHEQAAATLDECIQAAEALGDERLTALALNNRGDVALLHGDLETAADHFTRSLELLRAANDSTNVARALYNLGALALEQGRDAEAGPRLQESLELAIRLDDTEDTAWSAIGLAGVAAAGGRERDGAVLLGFANVLVGQIGAAMKPFEQQLFDRTRTRLQSALGQDDLADALAAGALLEPEAALELARSLARA